MLVLVWLYNFVIKQKTSYTAKVVIFAGGKFQKNVGKIFSCKGYFHDTSCISLIKSNWFYFRMGEIFVKKAKSQKMKIAPTRKFPCLQYICDCTILVSSSSDLSLNAFTILTITIFLWVSHSLIRAAYIEGTSPGHGDRLLWHTLWYRRLA